MLPGQRRGCCIPNTAHNEAEIFADHLSQEAHRGQEEGRGIEGREEEGGKEESIKKRNKQERKMNV